MTKPEPGYVLISILHGAWIELFPGIFRQDEAINVVLLTAEPLKMDATRVCAMVGNILGQQNWA